MCFGEGIVMEKLRALVCGRQWELISLAFAFVLVFRDIHW